MEYKYTGIILNKRSVGETDRLYTAYTLEAGKIITVAKGVRKAKAKLASALETFTLVDMTVIKNRGMGKITGSIIEQDYAYLKNNGSAMLEVFQGITVFNKIVDIESKDEEIFWLLADYLETANHFAQLEVSEEKHTLLRLGFCVKLLESLGYKIEADICVLGNCNFSGERFYFSPKHGGVVCTECAISEQGMMPISANTVKIIRIFFQNRLQSFGKLKVEKKELDSLGRLLQDFLAWSL